MQVDAFLCAGHVHLHHDLPALKVAFQRCLRAESESLKTEEDLIMKVVSLASLTPPELEREQERIINNPELFLRLAEAVNIPKGKSGKLNPTKPLFDKLMKVAHRLDRNIQQGA